MMRRLAPTLAIALALGFVPPAAVASDPGVHVDPGSPAGKEYALPVNSARQNTAGGSKHGKKSTNSLFGAGVKSGGGSTGSTGATGATAATQTQPAAKKKHKRHAARRHRKAVGGAVKAGPNLTAHAKNAGFSVPSDKGGSSFNTALSLIGASAGILALGAVAGLLLRRRETN